MFVPRVPNPYDDDAQRTKRIEAQLETGSRFSVIVFVGGWLVIGTFVALAFMGLPGAGLVLVPIGVVMIVGSGIQLLINRVSS